MIDEEIKVTEGDRHEGVSYNHPSFGMMRVAKVTGNYKGFGTEIENTGFIEITISGCEVSQNLGTNWYFAKDQKVLVRMSPVQYAEMITSPNEQGTPCTIARFDKNIIVQKHIDTKTITVEKKLTTTMSKVKKDVANLQRAVNEILDRKGAMKKADKDEIKQLYSDTLRKLVDDLPFYEKCLAENIDKMKSEAYSDINCHIQHAINSTGMEVLKDKELTDILINHRANKEIESK